MKNLPAMYETQVWSLGQEQPMGKGKAAHSGILETTEHARRHLFLWVYLQYRFFTLPFWICNSFAKYFVSKIAQFLNFDWRDREQAYTFRVIFMIVFVVV